MDKKEMKEKFSELYIKMAASTNVENMKLFGRVMDSMMNDLIESNPEKAAEYIEKLEAVKWDNYLTEKEAEKIVANMDPKAPWNREQWKLSMEQSGLKLEEWPHFNRCALWVTMNMVMSDSGETIKGYINTSSMLRFVYDMAIDKLKDKDRVFNIRRYFNV